MPKKRYNAEEIIQKLREADVLLGQRQKCQPGLQADRCQQPDLLSLAQKLQRDESQSGKAAKRSRSGERGPEWEDAYGQ